MVSSAATASRSFPCASSLVASTLARPFGGRGARGVVVADFRQDAVHLRHLLTHRLCILFQRLHGLGQCPEALACLFRQSLEEPVRLEADHHFSSTVLAGP